MREIQKTVRTYLQGHTCIRLVDGRLISLSRGSLLKEIARAVLTAVLIILVVMFV